MRDLLDLDYALTEESHFFFGSSDRPVHPFIISHMILKTVRDAIKSGHLWHAETISDGS